MYLRGLEAGTKELVKSLYPVQSTNAPGAAALCSALKVEVRLGARWRKKPLAVAQFTVLPFPAASRAEPRRCKLCLQHQCSSTPLREQLETPVAQWVGWWQTVTMLPMQPASVLFAAVPLTKRGRNALMLLHGVVLIGVVLALCGGAALAGDGFLVLGGIWRLAPGSKKARTASVL